MWWYKRMERDGDTRTTWDRESLVWERTNRGVMRIMIDISWESHYISWEARGEEEGLRQRAGQKITRENQIPRLTLLVWFILPFLFLATTQTFTWKMQSSAAAQCMLFLTTGCARMTGADGVAARLCDKSWWNMSSCHLPSVQTRHGCERRERVPCKNSLSLYHLVLVSGRFGRCLSPTVKIAFSM